MAKMLLYCYCQRQVDDLATPSLRLGVCTTSLYMLHATWGTCWQSRCETSMKNLGWFLFCRKLFRPLLKGHNLYLNFAPAQRFCAVIVLAEVDRSTISHCISLLFVYLFVILLFIAVVLGQYSHGWMCWWIPLPIHLHRKISIYLFIYLFIIYLCRKRNITLQ